MTVLRELWLFPPGLTDYRSFIFSSSGSRPIWSSSSRGGAWCALILDYSVPPAPDRDREAHPLDTRKRRSGARESSLPVSSRGIFPCLVKSLDIILKCFRVTKLYFLRAHLRSTLYALHTLTKHQTRCFNYLRLAPSHLQFIGRIHALRIWIFCGLDAAIQLRCKGLLVCELREMMPSLDLQEKIDLFLSLLLSLFLKSFSYLPSLV